MFVLPYLCCFTLGRVIVWLFLCCALSLRSVFPFAIVVSFSFARCSGMLVSMTKSSILISAREFYRPSFAIVRVGAHWEIEFSFSGLWAFSRFPGKRCRCQGGAAS